MNVDRHARWALPLMAAAMALLNAVKPVYIDDTFTLWITEQIARAPFDPYGLEVFWQQWPQPASENLTPPVLPYWSAIAKWLFGDSVTITKLWLFPFCGLLVVSLYHLFRRLGAKPALPFVMLIVLSPTHLPALNLMQDIPAQALGLTALVVYLTAHDRESWSRALAAALFAALAAQTKYTQVGIVGVMLVHGVLFGRLRLAAGVAFVSGALFLSWEWLMGLRYGEGMLVGQLGMSLFWVRRTVMVQSLLPLLGATAPFIGLLSLHALGLSRAVSVSLGTLVLIGFGMLVAWPIEASLFTVLGVLVVVAVACLAARGGVRGTDRDEFDRRGDGLLIAWLLIELFLYFAVAPFPAARRVIGFVVVGAILAARHVPRTIDDLRTTWALVIASSLVGCLFAGVDLQEARAHRQAVLLAEASIRQDDPQPTIWFVGHWGFQHYAERQGMQPVVPDSSRLAEGDWLLVPNPVHTQKIRLEPREFQSVSELTIPALLPLGTGPGYYGGATPLSHLRGSRFDVSILRARRDFTARSAWSAQQLWQWTETTTGHTAANAVTALVDRLDAREIDERLYAVRGLANIGSAAGSALPALRDMTRNDPNEAVRLAAEQALGAIEAAP